MDQQLIEKVMRQVSDELGIKTEECKAESVPAECASQNIGMTEFVGTAMGDTIGLVIASVDPMLKDVMNLGKFRSIGIIGARTGAGPQIWAVDEAVKATNTEIISVELPKGRRRPRKLNLHRCRGCIRCQKSGRDRTSGSSEIFRRCIRKRCRTSGVPVYRKSKLLS